MASKRKHNRIALKRNPPPKSASRRAARKYEKPKVVHITQTRKTGALMPATPRNLSGGTQLHDEMLQVLKNTYVREVMLGNRDRPYVQQIAAVIEKAEK